MRAVLGVVNARVFPGTAYVTGDCYRGADVILKEVVAADPNNLWAQQNLNQGLLALGDVERSTACLLRTSRLNPKDQQTFMINWTNQAVSRGSLSRTNRLLRISR